MANHLHDSYKDLAVEFSQNNFSNQMLPFLEVNESQYKSRSNTFSNCKFSSLVHFKETNLQLGLLFETCEFFESLVFTNIQASGYDVGFNPDSQNLIFRNCTFREQVQFIGKKSKIERSIFFKECIFLKGLNIENLNIELEGLTLTKCTINEKLDLFDIRAKQNISISDCVINSNVRIEEPVCDSVDLIGENIIKDELFIRHGRLEGGIIFNNGHFKKEVYITSMTTKREGLVIIGSIFEKAFSVEYHALNMKPKLGINIIYLNDSSFLNGITIRGKRDMFANSPIVDKIGLEVSAKLKGDISISDLDVGIIDIKGYNTAANILMKDLLINRLIVKGFINNAGLIFSGIKASHNKWFYEHDVKMERENAIYIDDTNFGKAQFYRVDFASFSRTSFHNDILTEISTSLVKWFTPEQLEGGISKEYLEAYSQAKKEKDKIKLKNTREILISLFLSQREIYRQLKFAAQKQGDTPQALEFQRHEMNYYRKIVQLRQPRDWSEHLILWSNQTNNFGQNWIKAFWLLIGFSLISYIPIGFLTSPNLDYAHTFESWHDITINLKVIFYDNFKVWFIILNPAHRINDVSPNLENYSSWIFFWDIISRIIIAYFIFQTISAFRKFNK